jgi:hypothetical protein
VIIKMWQIINLHTKCFFCILWDLEWNDLHYTKLVEKT